MHLKIVTVDKTILDTEVTSIHTRSASGEFIILDHHAPVIVMTQPGPTVILTAQNERRILFTSTGVIRVRDQEALFITDAAEWKETIDEARVRQAKAQAQAQLAEGSGDQAHARASLLRAEGRLKTLETV